MAPEQLSGKAADVRSDLYSLGALLYEAAAAKRPFDARIPTVLIADILNISPRPIRHINPDISAGLDNLILRCLAKDPAQRYQRAYDVGAALEALGNGASVGLVGSIASINKSRVLTYFVGDGIIVAIAMIGTIAGLRAPKKHFGDQPRELAVLPLTASGTTGEALAFGNGLVETLTSRLSPLSRNHSLQVVPASEIQAMGVTNLQQASQQFGATLGLELNVEHSGKFVRVNYALIDANQHKQISGGTITAPISDPFAVQDQVADNVLKSLEIDLDPQERQRLMVHGTSQPAACDYYLQGRG
jgi:TolB-like protein